MEKKTRKRSKKRSGKASGVEAWEPSMPLPGGKGKHEAVVQALLKGLDLTNAYRSQYGGTVQVAAACGSRLLSNAKVAARLAWLQKQVEKKVQEEVCITKLEGVQRIFEGLDFTIVDIVNAVRKQIGDADLGEAGGEELTPDERRAALLCTEISMTPAGPRYKVTPWLERLAEIGGILGWKKQELKLSGNIEVTAHDAIVARVRSQPFEVQFKGGD